MSQDKPVSKVNNPKAMLAANPLFEPSSHDTRVECLKSVFDVLTTQKPVNLHSPIVIIAPTPMHNVWRAAARDALPGRYVEYKNVHDFDKMVSNMEIQWVIIMDDVYPDQRPKMKDAIQRLKIDLGHRMFTVTPEYRIPVNSDTQLLSILGQQSFNPTNPFTPPTDEDPRG